MREDFKEMCDELVNDIQASYESGITIEDAEKLAGKFLYAQLQVANELADCDLDARMKKSGVKAIEAAVYLETASKGEKKPSDVLIKAVIDSDQTVIGQKEAQDRAEVNTDQLQNYLNIFKEAHIHFRAIAKGRFE